MDFLRGYHKGLDEVEKLMKSGKERFHFNRYLKSVKTKIHLFLSVGRWSAFHDFQV